MRYKVGASSYSGSPLWPTGPVGSTGHPGLLRSAQPTPWMLARALEASSVGQAALEALEEAVGEFARSYPSTAPTVLARPVLEHFRDVTRLLDSPLPVARRQRLAMVAGHLAGLALAATEG